MRRVFIMDDNELNIRLYTDLLTSFGCQICSCMVSAEAYDAVKDFQPDVAFLDINMPHESGLSVGKRIRPLMGDRPIIALTAMSPESLRDQLHDSGFTDILRKPCPAVALRQWVE